MEQLFNDFFSLYLINMTKLKVLGVHEKYVYFFLFFISLLLSYVIIQPIITWIMSLYTTKLLSYIFSSLFVMVVFFLVVLIIDIRDLTHHMVLAMFKIVLQSLAAFGLSLILFYSIQRLFRT